MQMSLVLFMQNSHTPPQSRCTVTVGKNAKTKAGDQQYWMGILMTLLSKKILKLNNSEIFNLPAVVSKLEELTRACHGRSDKLSDKMRWRDDGEIAPYTGLRGLTLRRS